MKNTWAYTLPLLILCLITCLSFLVIFGLVGSRFLIFFTFNTALSVVISRSSKSCGDDILLRLVINSFAYEDKEAEIEVGSSCDSVDDHDDINTAPNEIDDCECDSEPELVQKHVNDDEEFLDEEVDDDLGVDDDLEKRSQEFIEKGRQRWREEMERDHMNRFR
ncbi:hypothetical protein Lser_V15G30491 [Lactuca serriola]